MEHLKTALLPSKRTKTVAGCLENCNIAIVVPEIGHEGLTGLRRYHATMVTIVLIAGSMTLGVVLSRATLSVLFRVAEYTRSFLTR
jgi:hypothetical protein